MTAKPFNRTSKNLKHWEMDFNPSKCQVLHSSRSRNPIKHPHILRGQVFQEVDNAKYLGLEISCGLSWNNYIQNLTVNANRTLGFIRRNIRTKHKNIRETAYNTLVRLQIEYASPVWKVKRQAMIRNSYNQIPHPALKTKRETTKYTN